RPWACSGASTRRATPVAPGSTPLRWSRLDRGMSNYRQQAQLDVSIEEVWRLVGDIREHPRWWPRVLDVQCEGIEQGCRYRQVTKEPLGGKRETTMLVERLDRCRQSLVRCLDVGTYA